MDPSNGSPLVPGGRSACGDFAQLHDALQLDYRSGCWRSLHFNFGVDHQRRLRSARWQAVAKLIGVDAIEGLKITGIVEPGVDLDDIFQRAARLGQDRKRCSAGSGGFARRRRPAMTSPSSPSATCPDTSIEPLAMVAWQKGRAWPPDPVFAPPIRSIDTKSPHPAQANDDPSEM